VSKVLNWRIRQKLSTEKKEKNELSNELAIKNLLIVSLLMDGVDPAAITLATGIPEKTI